MDFTREPIIETVITPKEGCKLVVRSSKSNGQEEHFVDAIEVVSFGHSFFFRSLERPKTFLVPATDYEILEVREARMVLKNVGIDRAIKIAGGREGQMRTQREIEKVEPFEPKSVQEDEEVASTPTTEKVQEGRVDKKRERRRNYRRRRGRDGTEEEVQEGGEEGDSKIELKEPQAQGEHSPQAQQILTTSILTSLLPPPPTLISETIARYKDNILFKDAFYVKEEKVPLAVPEDFSLASEDSSVAPEESPPLPQPEYGSFEVSEEEEEEIYRQRKNQKNLLNDEEAADEEQEKNEPEDEGLKDEESGFLKEKDEKESEEELF